MAGKLVESVDPKRANRIAIRNPLRRNIAHLQLHHLLGLHLEKSHYRETDSIPLHSHQTHCRPEATIARIVHCFAY